jgi:hypothetical protein
MTFSRANAAHDRAQSLMKQSQELLAVAQVLAQARADRRHALLHGQPSRPARDLLRQSECLRLQARLETMPVIEQAKGILMAQSRCSSDAEAFDLLRRASQRSNIPVRKLAAQIVANAARAQGRKQSRIDTLSAPGPGRRHPSPEVKSPGSSSRER